MTVNQKLVDDFDKRLHSTTAYLKFLVELRQGLELVDQVIGSWNKTLDNDGETVLNLKGLKFFVVYCCSDLETVIDELRFNFAELERLWVELDL